MSVEPLMTWEYEDRANGSDSHANSGDATSGWPALVRGGMVEGLLVEHGSYIGVLPASSCRNFPDCSKQAQQTVPDCVATTCV